MTPHEEAGHLANAFRQSTTVERKLALVRRIRKAAHARLRDLSRSKLAIRALHRGIISLKGESVRLPARIDLDSPDTAAGVLAFFSSGRDETIGPDDKQLVTPSELAALRLLRACDHALNIGQVQETLAALAISQ